MEMGHKLENTRKSAGRQSRDTECPSASMQQAGMLTGQRRLKGSQQCHVNIDFPSKEDISITQQSKTTKRGYIGPKITPPWRHPEWDAPYDARSNTI